MILDILLHLSEPPFLQKDTISTYSMVCVKLKILKCLLRCLAQMFKDCWNFGLGSEAAVA